MSAKTIATSLPAITERPPLMQHFGTAVRALFKKLAPAANSSERTLAIEDRLALGPKKSLVVVRCHGQRFLVATSAESVGPIHKLAGPKATRRFRTENKA